MRRIAKKILLFVLLIILICFSFNKQKAVANDLYEEKIITLDGEDYIVEYNPRFEDLESPKVAISLAGGGAKAFYNIGVIKALEEEEIPIDIITGTSMGSIIGTMYGSGLSISQIEELVTEIPFTKMFDLNLGNRGSLLNTYKVNQFIEEIAPNKRLEAAKIPTGLLSYDLNSGLKFIHTSGNISEIIQSSYAIPFYFPPYQIDDKFLIDPGIVEVTPAKAAKVLGADFVISTVAEEREEYRSEYSSGQAADRFLSLMQQAHTEPILTDYADQVITVDVTGYSFTDFDSADQLIDLGYQKTKEQLPEIKTALAEEGIALREVTEREEYDFSQLLRDLDNDRLIIDQTRFRPLFYYGQNQSAFQQDLFKNQYYQGQFGFELQQKYLNSRVLAQRDLATRVEVDFRRKKLTENIDGVAMFRQEEGFEQIDWKFALKYYANNYDIELGRASLDDTSYNYLANSFEYDSSYFDLEGESDLLFSDGIDSAELLQSLEAELSEIGNWIVTTRGVYNDTTVIPSPIIYRGVKEDDYIKKQLNLESAYKYELLDSVKIMNFLQLNGIRAYLFLDYSDYDDGIWASGVGANFELDLLGLKPINFKLYTAVDDNETANVGVEFNFDY